jgi:PAS domain S-box-containing protein
MATRRILVVEDEAIIAMDIAASLRAMGYEVVAVEAHGEAVVAKVGALCPDLVLMDIFLAGEISGIEAATKIRDEYGTPVVFLTSHEDDQTIEGVLETGSYAYLTKPYTEHTLSATIELAINHHRVETELRERELFTRSVVESLPDFIIVTTPDGRIVYSNPAAARSLGIREGEVFQMIGSHSGTQPGIKGDIKSGTEPPVAEMEEEVTLSDGTKGTVLVKSVPLTYRGGPAKLYLLTPITERKRLESDLQRYTRELEDVSLAMTTSNAKLNLLSSITRHDVHNQIVVISGAITLAMESGEVQEMKELMRRVEGALDRIQMMLRFTREYQQVGVKAPVWQDLKAVISHATQRYVQDKTIEIFCDLPSIEVLADPYLERVFSHIMENVVHHGVNATKVSFSSRTEAESVTIICEDNGAGVPDGKKEAIFQIGYGDHSGFGLFLSREILSGAGMTIQETGEAGKCALFEIVIPAALVRPVGDQVGS